MPSITVNVDDDLKDRMERHPEINWSEVTRQAIQEKIETLEVMDELTSGNQQGQRERTRARRRGVGVASTDEAGRRRQRRHLRTHR
jgi:hypothetical protein